MTLLEVQRTKTYGGQFSKEEQEGLWENYLPAEKDIYEKLFADVSEVERGTMKKLAKKYGTGTQIVTGFLNDISESLKQDIPTETMDENTEIVLETDPEKPYYNMIETKAEWLHDLETQDHILSAERKRELYHEQEQSGTVCKEIKVSRSDLCPCGSDKKYRYCYGEDI